MKENLLVSDYDGTFFTNNDSITLNIEAIREFRKNGGIFLLNTGRSFLSVKGQIRKYGIEYDYLGCLDGLATFDSNDNPVDYSELDDSNNDLIDDLRGFKFDSFQVHYLKDVYSPIVEKSFNFLDDNNREKLYNKISKLLSTKYQNLDVHIYVFYEMINYFIRNRGINKSNSIKAVLNSEKIDSKNVFTIGDEFNDLPMIKDYNGYVMKNSNQNLLKYALDSYNGVHELIEDINKERVLRR
jgi:hypothetical protein